MINSYEILPYVTMIAKIERQLGIFDEALESLGFASNSANRFKSEAYQDIINKMNENIFDLSKMLTLATGLRNLELSRTISVDIEIDEDLTSKNDYLSSIEELTERIVTTHPDDVEEIEEHINQVREAAITLIKSNNK